MAPAGIFSKSFSKFIFQLGRQDEDMLNIGPEFGHVSRDLAFFDHFPDGVPDHSRGHGGSAQANRFNVGRG